MHTLIICPCGSNKPYINCCELYHKGAIAPDAGILMPSRYSAYVFQLTDYLLKTWHPSTRPEPFHFDQKMKHKWLGLEIKNCTTLDPHTATVEFIAHYKVNDVKHYLHEISRFSREDGFWYYVTGIFPE